MVQCWDLTFRAVGLNTTHTRIKSDPNTGHSEKIRFIVSTISLRTMVLFGPDEINFWLGAWW